MFCDLCIGLLESCWLQTDSPPTKHGNKDAPYPEASLMTYFDPSVSITLHFLHIQNIDCKGLTFSNSITATLENSGTSSKTKSSVKGKESHTPTKNKENVASSGRERDHVTAWCVGDNGW